MFYPPSLTNIPSQCLGRLGLDSEILDSLGFHTRTPSIGRTGSLAQALNQIPSLLTCSSSPHCEELCAHSWAHPELPPCLVHKLPLSYPQTQGTRRHFSPSSEFSSVFLKCDLIGGEGATGESTVVSLPVEESQSFPSAVQARAAVFLPCCRGDIVCACGFLG